MEVVILIPILAGIGLFIWSEQVKEEHPILSLMFQLMFIPLIFITVHLAIIYASVVYSANSELVSLLTDISYYFGWLLFGVGVYYCFVVMSKVYDIVQLRKAAKEEKYD